MMPRTRFEQDYIISVLEQHDGRVRDAAGVSDPATNLIENCDA